MNVVDRLGVGLLERDDELAALNRLLDDAAAGEGALVLIEGPAGIGKTSLLDACGQGAASRRMAVLRAVGDQLLMGSSFAAVRELLFPAVRDEASLFEGAARLAARVFEPDATDSGDPDRVGAVLHGLYWLVTGLAERRPLVLLVDDAHWLDAASARFIAYLARRAASLPVLLAVAARAGEPSGVLEVDASLDRYAAIALQPRGLTEEASGVLVREALGQRADAELCRSCHAATSGNPFYLHELVTALTADRDAPIVGAADRVRALGVGAIGRSVLVRLAGLGLDCERLAQAVAALGPGAQLRHAAVLAELPRERAETAADQLRAADLLRPETELAFVHPIVAEAVAAELPTSRRSALHRRAAQVLLSESEPVDRVAAHLLGVEPYGEAWVIETLRTAARRALSQGAPEAAVSYLDRALAEPPAADARLEVLVELGAAQTYLPSSHDFPALRQALELARDPRRRAEIAIQLAWALMGIGRNDIAAPLLEGILEAGDPLDESLVEHLEMLLVGGGLQALDAAPRARARAARYLDRAKRGEIEDPWLLAALAMNAPAGVPAAAEAAALARASVRDERLWGSWPALLGSTMVLTWADALEEAADVQDRAIADAQRRGSAPMFMAATAFRSVTALHIGDLDLAEDHARRALELAHEDVTLMVAASWTATILLERGRADEAAELLEPIELGEEALNLWHGCILLAARGAVRAALGEPQRGLADLMDADRRMSVAGFQLSVVTDWVPATVGALIGLGRHQQARDLCARELDDAIAFGASRRHGVALSLCGTLDPTEHGLLQLRQAVQILECSPARLAHTHALVNLGVGLHARGEREEARRPLSLALDVAHRLGAAALAERARSELIALGARPRRAALRGAEALTPAELRTARMAADGLTNRDIAQALFLSTRTVEAQLSGAYTKLAINSRAQLGDALGPGRELSKLGQP